MSDSNETTETMEIIERVIRIVQGLQAQVENLEDEVKSLRADMRANSTHSFSDGGYSPGGYFTMNTTPKISKGVVSAKEIMKNFPSDH